MIEGRPRQSLVFYEPPQEMQAIGAGDPFVKSFGGKFDHRMLVRNLRLMLLHFILLVTLNL